MTEPRRGFSALRRDHPVFFWGVATLVLLFTVGSVVVALRIPRYQREQAEINALMSETQRKTRDEILQAQSRRTELAVAVLRRDLRIRALEEKKRHLAIVLEDSVLELRHGPATLRRARISIGPDSVVRAPDGRTWRFVRGIGERRLADKQVSPTYTVPEWVYVSRGEPVPSEEERRVEGGLGRYVLVLDDGTEIYSEPQAGPLKGTVKPAAFMARAADLAAIFEAVKEDTPVYIY